MVQQQEPPWDQVSGEDAGAARAIHHVETLHCDVIATRTLERSLLAPAEARTFVAEQICPRHDALALAAAALAASEVVTHAAMSGEGPIIIALSCQVTTLTLSVTCSMDCPADTSGLRLADPIARMIVDGISRSCGTLPTEHGLTMWCTIPTGYLPAPTSRARIRSLSDPPVGSRPQTIRTLTTQVPRPSV